MKGLTGETISKPAAPVTRHVTSTPAPVRTPTRAPVDDVVVYTDKKGTITRASNLNRARKCEELGPEW